MEEFHSHRVLPLSPPESTIFLGFQLADGETNYQEHIPELSVCSRPVKSQSLLIRVKEESEKAGLKHLKNTKIMASVPIISWQI